MCFLKRCKCIMIYTYLCHLLVVPCVDLDDIFRLHYTPGNWLGSIGEHGMISILRTFKRELTNKFPRLSFARDCYLDDLKFQLLNYPGRVSIVCHYLAACGSLFIQTPEIPFCLQCFTREDRFDGLFDNGGFFSSALGKWELLPKPWGRNQQQHISKRYTIWTIVVTLEKQESIFQNPKDCFRLNFLLKIASTRQK